MRFSFLIFQKIADAILDICFKLFICELGIFCITPDYTRKFLTFCAAGKMLSVYCTAIDRTGFSWRCVEDFSAQLVASLTDIPVAAAF